MDLLNYKVVLLDLQNSIANETVAENREAVELIAANLNSLYGLLITRDGAQSDVFPITSRGRAVKFMVIMHTIVAFQFGSTIFDHLINGQYAEAAALLRPLIETVAFTEYYSANPDIALASVKNVASLPTRSTVFRFLAKDGKWPQCGPKKAFERYNQATHAHIAYVMQHWAETNEGTPQISRFWLRKYNRDSFIRISRDIFIPLFGAQQIFRATFIDEASLTGEESWQPFWKVGHKRSVMSRLYPGLRLGEVPSSKSNAA